MSEISRRHKVNDGCPEWADKIMWFMYEAEIKLGNLASDKEWSEDELKAIHKRVFEDKKTEGFIDGQTVDALFDKIAKGLSKEGFDHSAIASFVNARLLAGGKLTYCNASEVKEAVEG